VHGHQDIVFRESGGGADGSRFVSPGRKEFGLNALFDHADTPLFDRTGHQQVMQEALEERGLLDVRHGYGTPGTCPQ